MMNIAEPTVNVGLDGSDASERALEWALAEASLHGSPVRLLHGLPSPLVAMDQSGTILEALRANGDSILAAAAATAQRLAPDLVVIAQISAEAPAALLRDASVGARMTVLGTRGRGAITEAVFGSVAMRTLGHARGPVMIVRAEHTTDTLPDVVVLCLDGSPGSERAAAFAFEEAAARSVPVVAIRTWDDVPLLQGLSSMPLALNLGEVDDAEARALAGQVAPWSEKFPDIRVDQRVLRGRAAHGVLDFLATEFDDGVTGLVVVGSRGRSELAGILLGSTSQALVANGIWPTVVVGPR